jgi:hypothetical protein
VPSSDIFVVEFKIIDVFVFYEGVRLKVFHCDHCQQLVFFENTECVKCGHVLAFLPDLMLVGSLERPEGREDGSETLWQSPLQAGMGHRYRLCANYLGSRVCNWAVDDADPNPLCVSCRLTRVIPDLNVEGNLAAWYRLEVAKRRVVYTLLALGLPLSGVPDHQEPLTFAFLADAAPGAPPVLTGHANGVVTINIAEADEAERERRRTALKEPYRTLLGHMRHEVGHYYWSVLVERDAPRLQQFRELFGDEREDYSAALQRHYQNGPPSDWQAQFISSYASAHAWEDWAEVWAHYLHMTDTLEIAGACGVSLRPRRPDEPSLPRVSADVAKPESSFDRMLESWFPVTYLLNNLNRGLGLADGYPFVLSTPVIEKLRFVHETTSRRRGSS